MDSRYEMIYPPKGIFLNEAAAAWDWQPKDLGLLASSRLEWPAEGGLAYYPREQAYPFPGFPFPPIIDNVAIFKRFLLNRIKRPWRFIFWREFDELAQVSLSRYYMKPKFYCRAVRELYRLGMLITKNEARVHAVCMIFQWDPAYRFRLQLLMSRLRKVLGMRRAINETLDMAQSFDDNVAVQKKYKAAKILFNVAICWPPIYRKAKIVFDAMKNDQMALTEADSAFAFSKIEVVPVAKK